MDKHYDVEMAYARVSSKTQNLERQEQSIYEAIPDLKAKYFFEDKWTGKDFDDRPEYNKLKDKIDELLEANPNTKIRVTMHELDRLGRDFEEIQKEFYTFKMKGVDLRFLDIPDSIAEQTGVMGELVYMIILLYKAAVAQQELEYKAKRTREGIDVAKANGVRFGREAIKVDEKQFRAVADKAVNHIISHADAMKLLNIKPYLYWKHIKLWYPQYEGKHTGVKKVTTDA